jgi:hypothetical protein
LFDEGPSVQTIFVRGKGIKGRMGFDGQT